ncbi:primosomal protein [Rhodococcus sp. NPDC003318]|uniref:primosomal protein n=1 Tax=Rhodococcus sp. NPDC003318 TaxID=3364503 RepID=UPI0036859543
MAGDIVPIQLGLTEGDLVTLWAPRWREGDDEWEAFLGHEDDLYGFSSAAELAAFVRGAKDHDLVEHPSWPIVAALSAAEFEPDDTHVYDLIGVPELVAGDPDADTLGELEDTFEMARSIGEVCELDAVTRFFSSNPLLGAVAAGPNGFVGRDGAERWDRIGTAVADGWDALVDAIDAIVATPPVDAAAVAEAEAEIVAAEENVVDADDVADEGEEDGDDLEFVSLDLDDHQTDPVAEAAEDETFWTAVGIDPVKIITSSATYFTLRCYLDDDPVFLGKAGKILVFTSERALARYLADNHDHDLAHVSTYSKVQAAAVDGALEIEVTDENVYVLPGLADDLSGGPESVDVDQLDLAVELFTDAAAYADDESTERALASSTPLGWYVSYTLNPDPSRLAPSAPFTNEAEAWRTLEHEFESRLRVE